MAGSWRLWVCGEYCGVMADGEIKPTDCSNDHHRRVDPGGRVSVTAARNGWVSLRAAVEGRGEFRVRREADGIEYDLFREFYYKLADEYLWLADALVPAESGRAEPYFAHDLLRARQGVLDEGADPPPLLP